MIELGVSDDEARGGRLRVRQGDRIAIAEHPDYGIEHAPSCTAVEVVDHLVAQPVRVAKGVGANGGVIHDRVEAGEGFVPRARRLAATELAVGLVQAARRQVLGQIGGEEDARHPSDSGIECDRAVVGDESFESWDYRGDIGQNIAAEQPDAGRTRGALRIRARAERVRTDEQRRARAVSPGGDRPPFCRAGDRGIHRPVTPGGSVEHERSAVGQRRPTGGLERARRECACHLSP